MIGRELKRYKTEDSHSPEGLLVSLVTSFESPNRELIMENGTAREVKDCAYRFELGF